MRLGLVSFVLSFCLIAFVSGSITIHSTEYKEDYFKGDLIDGLVNVTINDEIFDSLVKNNYGENISVKDFLNYNWGEYYCEPSDCSEGYKSTSNSTSHLLSIQPNTPLYAGFYFKSSGFGGDDISSISMNFSSSFSEGESVPLKIKFFEELDWSYSEFSNNYSSKKYGCYDPSIGTTGTAFISSSSSYCEMIPLPETSSVRVGAITDNGDTKDLIMTIYPEEGGSYVGTCTYKPSQGQTNCTISSTQGNTFSEGKYQVCVSASSTTNYKIYQESSGSKCGFVYSIGPENSIKDYGIFAQNAYYKNSSFFDKTDFNFNEIANVASDFIENKYNGNCSLGCFLPLKIEGVSQNLNISTLALNIEVDGESQSINLIHKFDRIPAVYDYKGLLDLGFTGFKVNKSGVYKIDFDGKNIFSKSVSLIPKPEITSMEPINPPAGVETTFFANVDYSGNKSKLKYEWDFGDGTIETTSTGNVSHKYSTLSNYTLELKVSVDNLESRKSFLIKTISPKEAVNSTLLEKRASLKNVKNSINNLPEFYRTKVETLIDFSSYEKELEVLEEARNAATADEEYVRIAEDLFKLEIPKKVYSQKQLGNTLLDEEELIDPLPVIGVDSGSSESYIEDYKKAIVSWQNSYIDYAIAKDVIYLEKQSGSEYLLTAYHLDIFSTDEERSGYLVIELNKDSIIFDQQINAISSGESTIIEFPIQGKLSFGFYYAENKAASIFVSPKLSTLVIESAIDYSCNYNNFCEEGETWKTCRSDCKPVKLSIILMIVGLVFVLILYILLQLWYKIMYEGHLFGDRKQLYNLLMFISNARVRGMQDSEIERQLKKQGWSSERVTYAIKKSLGKNTGMPEIIPFTRIAARRREKEAKSKMITQTQQQNNTNINKSGFQGSVYR